MCTVHQFISSVYFVNFTAKIGFIPVVSPLWNRDSYNGFIYVQELSELLLLTRELVPSFMQHIQLMRAL